MTTNEKAQAVIANYLADIGDGPADEELCAKIMLEELAVHGLGIIELAELDRLSSEAAGLKRELDTWKQAANDAAASQQTEAHARRNITEERNSWKGRALGAESSLAAAERRAEEMRELAEQIASGATRESARAEGSLRSKDCTRPVTYRTRMFFADKVEEIARKIIEVGKAVK